MQDQISDPNPHVVQPMIGQAGGNGESESAVDNAQGIQISPSPEQLTKHDSARKRQKGKQWAGNMSHSK